jgi:glycosyltransferase involved in cell wall biosynthesis
VSSAAAPKRRTFVFISQVYLPDPASVGQHFADACAELARRGHRVVVLTAANGYDDASRRYPLRERLAGVDVRRLRFSSFGKGRMIWRLLAGISFTIQATVRTLLMHRVDSVIVSTVPPVVFVAAVVIGALRRVRITFWVMDLNPDQAVALGVVRPDSLSVRLLDWGVRRLLRRADDVVVLDRFMSERITAKASVRDKLVVLPPWPLDDHLTAVAHEDNPFRRDHGLEGRFVVMYSGNHSPANPIDTLIDAARALQSEQRLVFVFVGGGSDKVKVEQSALPNVLSLPYQPLESLKYSLSAADVHVVTLGDSVVGIVHPCKVYGAMAVARPVMAIGPAASHVADLLGNSGIGWQVRHGDVEGAVRSIREAMAAPGGQLSEMGSRGLALIRGGLSKDALCGGFCDVLERRATSAAA